MGDSRSQRNQAETSFVWIHQRSFGEIRSSLGTTSISLTAAYSDPFNLAANGEHVEFVSCPDGYVAIGGGVDTDSIDDCAIQESGPSDVVGEWFINLTCSATGSATNARALAVCLKGVTVV